MHKFYPWNSNKIIALERKSSAEKIWSQLASMARQYDYSVTL